MLEGQNPDLSSSWLPTKSVRLGRKITVISWFQTSASSHPQTTADCSAPVPNWEEIENKIRKNIQCSWRDILKLCQEKDVSKIGEIPLSDFLGSLPSEKCFTHSQMCSVFFLVLWLSASRHVAFIAWLLQIPPC